MIPAPVPLHGVPTTFTTTYYPLNTHLVSELSHVNEAPSMVVLVCIDKT